MLPAQSAAETDPDATLQRNPRAIDDTLSERQPAHGYAAITHILQRKSASVPLIALMGPYSLATLVTTLSAAYTRFTEVLGDQPDQPISEAEKQVYFLAAQVNTGYDGYPALSRRQQHQAQYQWLKRLLDRLTDNAWVHSLTSGIENALQLNTLRAELEDRSKRILAEAFQAHRHESFPMEAICQYIVKEKIAAVYLAIASPSERIRTILEIENQAVPVLVLGRYFRSTKEMISQLSAGYAEFKQTLNAPDIPEQAVADYFLRAQADARVAIQADDLAPQAAEYRWLKQFLCNIPENVVVNGFATIVPLLEHKGQQALEEKQDSFDNFMDSYLPTSIGLNPFIRSAIRRICLQQLKATHEAPSVASRPTQPAAPSQSSEPNHAATTLTAEYGIAVPPEAESVLLWGEQLAPASLEALCDTLNRRFDNERAKIDPGDIRSPSRVAYAFMIEQAKAYYRRKYEDPTAWTFSQLTHKSKDYITILWSQYEDGRAAMQAIEAGLPGATQGKMLSAAEDACRKLVFEQLPSHLDALLRAAMVHVILKGVSPFFSLHLELEARDPLLDSIGFTSDDHVQLCLGQAAGKRRGQALTPSECLTLGLAEVKAIHDEGTAQEKGILTLSQALLWAKFNQKLSAGQFKAWSGGALSGQSGMEQLLQLYRDRHGVQAEWEKELSKIHEMLRKLPTLTSAYDDLLKKYGYTHKSSINVKASYHWSAQLSVAAQQAYACNNAMQLCKPAPDFTPYFWGRFEESLLQRAGDFSSIEFKPAATSEHAGAGMVKLTPEDLKNELKRQLDEIKSTLENKAGEMLLLMLKPALTKQAELRKQALGHQAPDEPLDMAYVRIESLYRVSASLDHDSQRPGLPSEALQWPRQARNAQPNAMILKIHTGLEDVLWVVRFNPETGALLYLKSLQLPPAATATRSDMIPSEMEQYVQAHPTEFFEEVPNPGRAGLIVRYAVHEVAVARTSEMPTGRDVQALRVLQRWFGPGRWMRHDEIPGYLRTLHDRVSQWGLGQDKTQPELNEAVAVLNALRRRFCDADPAYSTPDAVWRPVLAMNTAERLKLQNALPVLGTEFKRRISAEQARYFHALATGTGISAKITRLFSDAERFVHQPSVGEFIVDLLPFVSGGKHIAAIHHDYITTAIDQHTLLVGGPRPHQKSGDRALFQDRDLAVGYGMGIELLALIPVVVAVGQALRMAKLTLMVSSKLAAIAYFQQQSVAQIARQVLTHPLMHAAAGALRKTAVQAVIQGVDLVSPIPLTDQMLNTLLNKVTRGLRTSAKLARGVNTLLQATDPVLLKRLVDMPAIEAPPVLPRVLPAQLDVDTHFKIGVQGNWQIALDNPPAVEIRNGLRYIKDSEIAIATAAGQEVAVKQVGSNALGEAYFKRIDLLTGELEDGTLRMLPPVGSEASEAVQVEIVQYRRMDGTVETTHTTLDWDQVSQVANGDETHLMVRPHDTYYVLETQGDTTGLRVALDEEVAAFVLCFDGLSRVKRAPKKLPCKRSWASSRISSRTSSTSSSEDYLPSTSARTQKRAKKIELVQRWRDKLPAERSDGAYTAFDKEHAADLGLKPGWLATYSLANGTLTSLGEKLLGIESSFVPIAQQHIDDWYTAKALNHTEETRTDFAKRHKIDPVYFRRFVTPEGVATEGWANWVRAQQIPPYMLTRMTPRMLDAIQAWFRHKDRASTTLTLFADARGIPPNSLQQHISATGALSEDTYKWIDPKTGAFTDLANEIKKRSKNTRGVTAADVADWQRIAADPSINMTQKRFCEDRNIAQSSLSKYVNAKGQLTNLAQKKRWGDPTGQLASNPAGPHALEPDDDKIYHPVEIVDLQEFLLPATPRQPRSLERYAALNALDIDELSQYIRPDRTLSPEGWDRLSQELSEQDIEAPGTANLTWEIDNNAFLFSDIDAASKNLLHEHLFNIDGQQAINWGSLDERFQLMPPDDASSKKRYLAIEFDEWLDAESALPLGERDTDRLFRQFMHQALIDHVPSVVAAQNLPAFTILGPYRGELIPIDESVKHLFIDDPRHHVLSYLFAMRSGKPMIKASVRGNLLSLINTGQLPGGDVLRGLKPMAPNNVALVKVGKDIDFYVTTEPISKGQELRVDFGPVEKPRQDFDLASSSQGSIADAQVDRALTFEQALINIRTPGQWQNAESDLIPRLAGDYFQEQGRGVAIRVYAADPAQGYRLDEFPPGAPNPITLELHGVGTLGAHYSATYRALNGGIVGLPTTGGGDCFYRALYATAYHLEPNAVTAENILTLRYRLAELMQSHPDTYMPFLRTEN